MAAPSPIARLSVVIPVYRDADRALNAAARILALSAGNPATEIIVVDDGSGDDTPERLRACLPEGVRLIELQENRGRSSARQEGIAAARGEAIMFLDCDCEPVEADFLDRHLHSLRQGCVASTGPVIGTDGGFWDRYQRAASERRRRLHERGVPYTGSTQNLMVRTSALRSVGGFDPRYRHYGFEDRDLLVRLAEVGDIAWTHDATVRHLDRVSMLSVSNKMRQCGRESAWLFATQHPDAYRKLGYASIDARLHRRLKMPARLFAPVLGHAARWFDWMEARGAMPWPAGFAIVRFLTAISYLVGTCEAETTGRA
ncbi:glycosyltransferase family 2 protein [Vulcaniibacterium gelatinicum]|uniref:glycosyltransferase family 2 protein n=1 Tax=Vulcaniibacterium gelatinicum TaxID=2598725 RepID=UPI0011CCDA3E|nr:glycosyltransferase family A protein [Vulcaniibacterium gelatinicum]